MININFQHCNVSDPKRFKNESDFHLECILEVPDVKNMLESKVSNDIITKYSDEIRDVSSLKEIKEIISSKPINEVEYFIVNKAIRRIYDTDRQLFLDIVSAISAMIDSKISTVKGNFMRDMITSIFEEINGITEDNSKPYNIDEEVADFMSDKCAIPSYENSSFIPDGATQEEEDEVDNNQLINFVDMNSLKNKEDTEED